MGDSTTTLAKLASLVAHDGCYWLQAAFLAFLVRIFVSLFNALDAMDRDPNKLVAEFAWVFSGFHQCKNRADYWQNFVLGWLEFLAYPMLLATSNFKFVGAWLAFKTLGQWNHWGQHRQAFNRFLIGNALVLLGSMFFMAPSLWPAL